MCDFDLSDALDCPLDPSNVTGFESTGFSIKDVEDECITLQEGLDLVVSHNRKTLKAVVNVVLALNKMKIKPQELSDDEFGSFIMDSVVDEAIVETVVNSTGQKKRSFIRLKSLQECTLTDRDQKALTRPSEALKLQAVTVKGGYNDCKVHFKLVPYCPSSCEDSLIVVVSIKQSDFHISCSMQGDKAVLNLEECSKESLTNISDQDMERFLFYKRGMEKSHITFESVKCPKWFISTSCEENQPVEMCRQETVHRLTRFRMI